MSGAQVLRGVSTVRYQASDFEAAKRWYTEFLGIEPYFNRPGYSEFRLGDYQHELALLDTNFTGQLGREADRTSGPSGAVVYWHVDDVPATIERLVEMGATLHEAPRNFGGFIAAAVIDPFGNILGIMYNPHYLEVLSAAKA